MIQLRPYQQEAVDAVYNHLRERDDNPCVVAATGTGKGVIIAQIASDAVNLWGGRVLILAHVKELLQQNAEKIQAIAPELDIGIYSAGLKRRDTEHKVIVAGIQSIYKRACELGPFDLVITDECHRIGSEGIYKQFLKDAKIINPNLRVIGLTATPYRLKGGEICKPENILNHVCYDAGIKEMIVNGYLSKLKSRSGTMKADLSNLHIRGGEFIASEMADAMDREGLVASACEEIVELTKDRKSVLIFTTSVEHCHHVAEEISKRANTECGIVTGDTPSGERAELLARFKGELVDPDLFGEGKPRLKYLANVNVLTTGFDATCVDCVVLLRPTASAGLYVQMCLDMKTEILTPEGWAFCRDLKIGDTVGSYDLATSTIVWSRVNEKVFRPLSPGESMYGVKAPHLDIRVTNQHTMVYRSRNKNRPNWQKAEANKLANYKSSYYIPIAGENEGVGVPLSDDEIRFFGWFLTDGSRNKSNNTIVIYQSSNSPYNKDIVSMLEGCGFGYRKYRVKRKGLQSKYSDGLTYVIPYGQPRGNNAHLRGWKDLAYYINNNLLTTLEDISQRQLEIFLSAMNLADGQKPKNISWTPRSYHIAIGEYKYLADSIQSLLIRRGYKCNISIQECVNDWQTNDPKKLYMLHIKKQTKATVGGANYRPSTLVKKRSKFEAVPFSPNEMVWCVSTDYGTIVTRRNGKVAILGNCGRGTRLHPGKEDCLILDYGGNVLRHGPVDAVVVKEKTKGDGEAPAKECPECMALIHAAYRFCPECNHEFPPAQTDIDTTASNEGILSGEITDTEHKVHSTHYFVHTKQNADPTAPRTMRIEYQVGFNTYVKEWVCPEHTGWARQRFEKWWRERSNVTPPATAHEAVYLADDGALSDTKQITVRSVAGEKFDKVLSYVTDDIPCYAPEPGWNDVPEDELDCVSVFEDEEVPF